MNKVEGKNIRIAGQKGYSRERKREREREREYCVREKETRLKPYIANESVLW